MNAYRILRSLRRFYQAAIEIATYSIALSMLILVLLSIWWGFEFISGPVEIHLNGLSRFFK